eukprot:s2026_g2.t1
MKRCTELFTEAMCQLRYRSWWRNWWRSRDLAAKLWDCPLRPHKELGLPCSLARLECLTPRPFYLPEQEPDLTNISGAPVPIDAEDGKLVIQQIPPEEEKSPDDSAGGAEDCDFSGRIETRRQKLLKDDEDKEAEEVVEKDSSAAENGAAAADVEVAEKNPDEAAAKAEDQ